MGEGAVRNRKKDRILLHFTECDDRVRLSINGLELCHVHTDAVDTLIHSLGTALGFDVFVTYDEGDEWQL